MPLLGDLLQRYLGTQFGGQTPDKDPNNYDPVTGELKPGKVPYKDPGFWKQFWSPDVARYQAEQNDWYRQQPARAVATSNARLLGEKTILQKATEAGGLDPDLEASISLGYGGNAGLNEAIKNTALRKTGNLSQIGTNIGNSQLFASDLDAARNKFNLGQFGTISDTEATQNQTNRLAAYGAAARQGNVEQVLDNEVRNRLKQSGLTDTQIDLATKQAQAELGRFPLENEIQNILQKTKLSEAKYGNLMGDIRLGLGPYDARTLQNTSMGNAYLSQFINQPQVPRSPVVTPEGNILTGQQFPGWVNPFLAQTEAMLGQTKGPGASMPDGSALPRKPISILGNNPQAGPILAPQTHPSIEGTSQKPNMLGARIGDTGIGYEGLDAVTKFLQKLPGETEEQWRARIQQRINTLQTR